MGVPKQFVPFTTVTNRMLALALIGLINVVSSTTTTAVQFDLRDTGATTAIESGSITRDGITATLTAIVEGNAGVLNQTSTGFGVNADGGGDESARLDGDEGAESISISFDVDVTWTGLLLSLFSAGEGAGVSLPAILNTPLADTGSSGDVYSFAADNVVLVGESVVLSWVSGNGFSFDSFEVEPYEAPTGSTGNNTVPDGGLSALLLVAGLSMVSLCRRHTVSR